MATIHKGQTRGGTDYYITAEEYLGQLDIRAHVASMHGTAKLDGTILHMGGVADLQLTGEEAARAAAAISAATAEWEARPEVAEARNRARNLNARLALVAQVQGAARRRREAYHLEDPLDQARAIRAATAALDAARRELADYDAAHPGLGDAMIGELGLGEEVY